jgi:hypothetical protein
MAHIIHVHQDRIQTGEDAIIDRAPEETTFHRVLHIVCPCGCDKVAGTMKQSIVPESPGGARVWIEAEQTRHDG